MGIGQIQDTRKERNIFNTIIIRKKDRQRKNTVLVISTKSNIHYIQLSAYERVSHIKIRSYEKNKLY